MWAMRLAAHIEQPRRRRWLGRCACILGRDRRRIPLGRRGVDGGAAVAARRVRVQRAQHPSEQGALETAIPLNASTHPQVERPRVGDMLHECSAPGALARAHTQSESDAGSLSLGLSDAAGAGVRGVLARGGSTARTSRCILALCIRPRDEPRHQASAATDKAKRVSASTAAGPQTADVLLRLCSSTFCS